MKVRQASGRSNPTNPPPFQPGNSLAVSHGGSVALWKLQPRIEVIATRLREDLPAQRDSDEATVLIRTARGYIGQWERELAATAPEMVKPGVAEHMVWELAVSAMTGVMHGALPRLAARMPRDPPGWERAALIVATYGHEVSWCPQDLADLDDPDADEVHVHNYLVLAPLERDVTAGPAPVSVVDEVADCLRVVPRAPGAGPTGPRGGRTVVCEACGADWTDRPDTGGFMYDDHPVGPCCARRLGDRARGTGNPDRIWGRCPPGRSFASWIRELRGQPGQAAAATAESSAAEIFGRWLDRHGPGEIHPPPRPPRPA